eukprot:scaffold5929_cov177-Alexandrium_tamarense.AAC.4
MLCPPQISASSKIINRGGGDSRCVGLCGALEFGVIIPRLPHPAPPYHTMATKAWLVIGTRSGIGLEIARQLSSAEGNEVFGSFYERLSFFGGDVGKTLLCE